jgi:hypothetical protein
LRFWYHHRRQLFDCQFHHHLRWLQIWLLPRHPTKLHRLPSQLYRLQQRHRLHCLYRQLHQFHWPSQLHPFHSWSLHFGLQSQQRQHPHAKLRRHQHDLLLPILSFMIYDKKSI